MKNLIKFLFIFMLTLSSMGVKAQSTTLGCNSNDLSGISVINCAGYSGGNLLSNSSSDLNAVKSIFSGLGFASVSTAWTEKLNNLGGTNIIDFNAPLNGISIIGIHKGGAGEGTQSTAFYVVDAGTNLNTFKYNLSGSSNAALYLVASPVPEPSSYIMMLIGLLTVGYIVRRKNIINK